MKFTSEDLMKAMGLKVGDKVKIKYKYGDEICVVTKQNKNILLVNESLIQCISNILDYDYEILPKPKRVGDLKCDDFDCVHCPLKFICCLNEWGIKTNENLFSVLEKFECDDKEIYELLKNRLSKEVSKNVG